MDHALKIQTLGGLSIQAGDQPVTGLASRKAELLLVYLVRGKRTYAREVLAELLWEGRSQSQAQANLRVVLSSLRQNLGQYLDIDRDRAGILSGAEIWLDANIIETTLGALSNTAKNPSTEETHAIKLALDLYQGEFLEGVYVQDAPELDAWMEQERQRLNGLVIMGLSFLTEHYLQSSEYQLGLAYAARLVELDPLAEAGQRQLMQLLALSGQRAAALNQYERLKLLLKQELGVDPEAATARLLRQIESGETLPPSGRKTSAPIARVSFPPYLQAETARQSVPMVFVGREIQIQELESALQQAIAGNGQLRFITGGAGQGKTALMDEFARRATDLHPDLLVAMGGCNAFTGVGDSYLPFRDVLGMLTGDLEAKLVAGKISLQASRRLWQALPVTQQALQEQGAHLINVFVQGSDLYTHLTTALPEQPALLQHWVELIEKTTPTGELQPTAIFDEYLQVLCAISKEYPLLVQLDDLQWADTASLNLLFHIGRRLAAGRILLVAAYRAEELALAEAPQADMLTRALAEFKRQYGDIWIDLSAIPESQGRLFVDAFLDSEPNCLDEPFRQALYAHTGGHALFTVELCRSLQERGMLQRDTGGYWEEQAGLAWDELPARVEGVIEARLGCLTDDQRLALDAAAVEGDEFTLQVVARVCGKEERWMVRRLSQELCQAHCLLSELGVRAIDGRRLYRYRFRHNLYREYLYQHLGEIDRSWTHAQVGAALEELYAGRADEIAPQLGWHYHQAGDAHKAIPYLLLAGDQAQQRYANAEAIRHYQVVIELLKDSGDLEQSARTLLKLGMAYHSNLEFERSRQAYAEGFSLWHRLDAAISTTSLPPAPHPLRIAGKAPGHLDKVKDDGYEVSSICNQVFCGLVTYVPDMGIIPDGAGSWEIQDNGLRYIFHLREEAAWSDGVPVTARDYVVAWTRALNPALQPVNANLLYDLKGARAYHQGIGSAEDIGVQAIDRFTLQVELEQPAGYFLHLLAYNYTFPVPAHILQVYGESWAQPGHIITNGAFKIEKWQPHEEMVLSRNPVYRGQVRGNVQRVEVVDIPGVIEGLKRYEADSLDILGHGYFTRVLTLVKDLEVRHPGEYLEVPEDGVGAILFNCRFEPFDDLRVRQAFAHALDKPTILNLPMSIFIPATAGLIPPSLPGHSPGIGLKFDPERARQLLAQAGYPGGKGLPKLAIVAKDIPAFRSMAEIIAQQWREILGVEVEKVFMDTGKSTDVRESFRESLVIAMVGVLPDYPDSDWFLRCFMDDFVRTPTGWHDDTYDQLLQAARLEHDQQKRMKFYQQADKLIIEQAIVAPIFYDVDQMVIKPWVKLAFVDLKYEFWKDFTIEPH
jgi:ABC-type oligopeptide transport system substrate-binding subunit/DNA-binding SARP family transcriptional activator